MQGMLEKCQFWEGQHQALALPQSSPRLGWAHREAGSEQGVQQQPENPCKDVGSGPALDPTGLAAPLASAATLAGLWAGVL